MNFQFSDKKSSKSIEIIFIKKLNKKDSIYQKLKLLNFSVENNSTYFDTVNDKFYIGTKKLDSEDLKIAVAKVINELKKSNIREIFISLFQDKKSLNFEALVEGIILSNYEYKRYKNTKDDEKIFNITISSKSSKYLTNELTKKLEKVKTISNSVNLVRDIVNTPPNDYTPQTFVDDAIKISKRDKLEYKIYSENALAKMGMNAMLSVGRASIFESKLIHLIYKPENPKGKLVLVGKGLTYDSGGLSLKSAQSMVSMKCDKAGASTVLGIMNSLTSLNYEYEVHGIIGAVENMIGGDAYKPDDVLVAKNGKTIEVKNTDAEGRLVLADCLCYAQDEIKNIDYIFDFATLTGACIVALGNHTSAVLGHNQKLKNSIKKSADKSGELLGFLPYNRYFEDVLKSEVADLVNTANTRAGGSITASLFLDNFIKKENKKKWLHFDIAGPAFVDKPWGYNPYGASGVGVRLILKFIEKLAK